MIFAFEFIFSDSNSLVMVGPVYTRSRHESVTCPRTPAPHRCLLRQIRTDSRCEAKPHPPYSRSRGCHQRVLSHAAPSPCYSPKYIKNVNKFFFLI